MVSHSPAAAPPASGSTAPRATPETSGKSLSAECPDCGFAVTLANPVVGEIVDCGDCGVELEVRALAPTLALDYAPEEEEDWGE